MRLESITAELRREAELGAPRDHIATRITWSAGDDDEHAWYWRAVNSSGRVVAYGYAHEQDEDAVVKRCGESGAVVAEDVEWRTE